MIDPPGLVPLSRPPFQSIKSIVFILYQILSERYQRFFSLKANMILNIIEALFWTVAIFLTGLGTKRCTSKTCAIAGSIVVLAVVQW